MSRLFDQFEEYSILGVRPGAWSRTSSIFLDLFENSFLRVDIVHFHDGRMWEVQIFPCYPNGDYRSDTPLIVTSGLTIEETFHQMLYPK
jgi:glycogen synthase